MKEIINPYGFIYITTNMVNGKRYIGQRKFNKGWKYYLGSGRALKMAISKYGKENFVRDIVDIAYSNKELNKLEYEWINNYNAVRNSNYYNLALGGGGGSMCGKHHSKETIEKIRKANIGKEVSKETREKLSEKQKGKPSPNKGKHLTEAQKEHLRQINIGKFKGEKHGAYGKQRSEETKEKIRKTLKGRKLSEEHKQHIRDGLPKGGNSTSAVKVRCITTGEKFDCIKEAGKYYNIKSSDNIIKVCKGERNYCGKFNGVPLQWEYM